MVHRKGSRHHNADALSRLPCSQCGRDSHDEGCTAVISATALQAPSLEGLREAQLADPTVGPLLQGKEQGRKPLLSELGTQSSYSRRLLQIWGQLEVHNGALCRISRIAHTSLMISDSKFRPWSECSCSGNPNRKKNSSVSFRTMALASWFFIAYASTQRVKYSQATRMYLFPSSDSGNGPTMSTGTIWRG